MCFWRWPKSAITKYATSPVTVLCNPKSPMLPASPEKFGTTPTLLPGENWWIFQERWGIFPMGYLSSFVSLPEGINPEVFDLFSKGNSQHGSPSNSTKHHALDPKNGAGWKVCLKNWASKRNDPHSFRNLEGFEVWGLKMWRYTWRISGEKWLDVCSFPMLSLQPRSFKFAYVFLAGIWNTNLLQKVSGQNNPQGPEVSKKPTCITHTPIIPPTLPAHRFLPNLSA